MIREEINELYVQIKKYNETPKPEINTFENIVSKAFNLLDELRKNYYLVPKENIDSNIKFATTDNIINDNTNVIAKFTVCAVSSIKRTLTELIHDNSVKNYLKSELIRTLEMKNKRW